MNNKDNYNLKYMPNDQLNSFEDFKKQSNNRYDNLAPINKMKFNNKNNYKGAKKTPFLNIENRYVVKNMTNKKEEK